MEAIGLKTAPVKPQTEPIILRLTGVTDYDPDTLTNVRSQFDCRVDKVLAQLGSVVKKGDPLLEVFSSELAEAKSNYEAALSQWNRDKRVLEYKSELTKTEALPRNQQIEIENDEAKSHLQVKLARDKLLVYGLTDKEIEDAKNEDGVQKAKMILRSRSDGIVIKRTVVQGNYYDSKDELMQIAPLDHLWVRGSVSEFDADKVEVGQTIRVVFPYTDRTIDDEVEYIDKAIDPETRSAKFRATIPESREEVQGRHVCAGAAGDSPQARPHDHPSRLDGLGRSARLRFPQSSRARKVASSAAISSSARRRATGSSWPNRPESTLV